MIKQEFAMSNQCKVDKNNNQDFAMKEESVKVVVLTCYEVDLEMPELRLTASPPPPSSLEESKVTEEVSSTAPHPAHKTVFKKEDRMVHVKNLPVKTTEDQLIKFFISFGLIRSIRWTTQEDKPLLDSRKDKDGVSATIEFVKRSGALASLKCIKMFHGKLINVSLLRHFTENELQQLKPDLNPLLPFLPAQENKTIFLKDLPMDTRQKELLNVFLPFGLIESIRWFTHNKTEIRDTSKLRHGLIDVFIVFCEDHSAEAAKSSVSLTINKTKVTISKKTYRQIVSEYFPGSAIQQPKENLVLKRLAAIKEDILPFSTEQEDHNILLKDYNGTAQKHCPPAGDNPEYLGGGLPPFHQQFMMNNNWVEGPDPQQNLRYNPYFMASPSNIQMNSKKRIRRRRNYYVRLNAQNMGSRPPFFMGPPGFYGPNFNGDLQFGQNTFNSGGFYNANNYMNGFDQQMIPGEYQDSGNQYNNLTLNVFFEPQF